MNRRTFIAQAAAASVGVQASAYQAKAPEHPSIIDCNFYIGHWPFRALPDGNDETNKSDLNKRGLVQVWTSSFDGMFHRDAGSVNAGLAAFCKKARPMFHPVGTINPALPGWKNDLGICKDEHEMTIIRLHPNYHGYKLDDSVFTELLAAATDAGMLVQIVAQMEDQRTQHPLMQVAPVDLKPLGEIMKRIPEARVMVLNANASMITTALRGTRALVDIAMLEGVGGIENLLKDWPLDQLVFGSHAPMFYWESAHLKLQESELSDVQLAAITHGNAERLITA